MLNLILYNMKKVLMLVVIAIAVLNFSFIYDYENIPEVLIFEQIEALGHNESSGDGYTVCTVGDKITNSSVSQVTWCGDCKVHRVVKKGDGRCKVG